MTNFAKKSDKVTPLSNPEHNNHVQGMAPQPFVLGNIGNIIAVTNLIKSVVNTMKGNQESCKTLIARIDALNELIDLANKLCANNNAAYSDSNGLYQKKISNYNKLLHTCKDFISEYSQIQEKNGISRFWGNFSHKNDYSAKFSSLISSLDQLQKDISFITTILNESNRREDHQELENDIVEMKESLPDFNTFQPKMMYARSVMQSAGQGMSDQNAPQSQEASVSPNHKTAAYK